MKDLWEEQGFERTGSPGTKEGEDRKLRGKDAPGKGTAQCAGSSGYTGWQRRRRWCHREAAVGQKGLQYEAEELCFARRGVTRSRLCLGTAPRAQRVRVDVNGSSVKQEVLRPGPRVAVATESQKEKTGMRTTVRYSCSSRP